MALSSRFNLSNGAKITLKLAIIAVLTLLMLIPQAVIQDLVRERQNRQYEVSQNIAMQVGGTMDVTGPILVVPYQEEEKIVVTNKGKAAEEYGYTVHTKYAYFSPNDLDIQSEVEVTNKRKSIYKIPYFSSTQDMKGNFVKPDFSKWESISPDDILWEDAFLLVGITSLRGLNENPSISWNNQNLDVLPGTNESSLFSNGIYARLPQGWDQNFDFQMKIELRGTNALNLAAIAKNSTMHMKSNWPDPNFESTSNTSFYKSDVPVNDYYYERSNSLPTDYDIFKDGSGFEANWTESQFSSNGPLEFLESEAYQNLGSQFMGVEFVNISDNYSEMARAVKYMYIIIIMLFMTFFMAELLLGNRVHPFQYILIGMAIAVFFILLVALSEYFSFGLSYLLSSSVTVILIGLYSIAVFHNRKISGYISLLLVGLFAFIYVLINATEYSLLIGAIGLFIVLALAMYLTRNVDWYGDEKTTE